ncbi:MAG: D-amino-acid transaminase [Rhodospirillaceae bacterium]
MSRIAYVNGRYVPLADAMVNVEDRGYQFADGVYEVVAVVAGRLVECDPHFERLDRSLGGLRIGWPCSRRVLRLILDRVIRRNGISDGYVYLQVTRGVAPRNHPFPAHPTAPSLVVTASRRAAPSPAAVERGVRIVSLPETRWARPDLKTVSLLPNVLAKQQAIEAGADEAWFLDADGRVTEGSSTNAWIVLDGQEIVTRPTGQDILAGITRQTLIEVARSSNMRVTERAFSLAEARSAREAFITSTTAFVMPVIAIDGAPVGDGRPGPVTLRLLDAYRRHLGSGGGD